MRETLEGEHVGFADDGGGGLARELDDGADAEEEVDDAVEEDGDAVGPKGLFLACCLVCGVRWWSATREMGREKKTRRKKKLTKLYINAAPCKKTAALYENCALNTSVQFTPVCAPSYTSPPSVISPTPIIQSHVLLACCAYVSFPVYLASLAPKLKKIPLLIAFL